MATTNFQPTSPTNQNRAIAKIINFCVFRPIWMKFGMGANMGLQTTWKEFERPMTIFWPTSPTNHNRPIAKILNFCVFHPILMKFGTGVVRCLVFLNIYSMERIQIWILHWDLWTAPKIQFMQSGILNVLNVLKQSPGIVFLSASAEFNGGWRSTIKDNACAHP